MALSHALHQVSDKQIDVVLNSLSGHLRDAIVEYVAPYARFVDIGMKAS